VGALLYHTERDAFVLVRQWRAPVHHYQSARGQNHAQNAAQNPAQIGVTYEICAGIMDKGKSERETMIEEIFEETGYAVGDVTPITSCYSGLGFGANRQTLFYAEVSESMHTGQGGGVDEEDIELFFLPRERALDFALDASIVRAPSLLFCLFWHFAKFG